MALLLPQLVQLLLRHPLLLYRLHQLRLQPLQRHLRCLLVLRRACRLELGTARGAATAGDGAAGLRKFTTQRYDAVTLRTTERHLTRLAKVPHHQCVAHRLVKGDAEAHVRRRNEIEEASRLRAR
ncbi:hypothetical protein DQ04_01141160 [Trypanosoma grayi]|uniref:hypothetical protein n=1 Tax=Trypanosoma grayi TaxID=71804 RepID=UPI0004F4498D|nr:hypothetical protein DQ04_01141160 [Trypanosoma grayi]KEG13230.1 hypothetical protein DQ04_01141160 [Trypanosoma grayi]